jgi:transcriptional regulator of acetoin/glycerol metabolism
MVDGTVILREHLPQNITGNFVTNTELDKPQELKAIKSMEKKQIEDTLLMVNNNVRIASEQLGLCKSTLYRKIREYNIDFRS